MTTSIENIVSLFLKKSKISLDWKEFKFQIQSHPTFPSLNSITGAFNHFNIDNVAVEIPVNRETLKQLPDIYLAQIKKDNIDELVLVQKRKLQYALTNLALKEEVIEEKDFLKSFTGVLVAIDNENFKRVDKGISDSNNSTALIFIASVLILLLFSLNIVNALFLLTSFFGIGISYAILKKELGLETKIGDTFCSSTNEQKDCDAVLNSGGAKIFKGFKLSDLSIIFFSTQSIVLIISTITRSSLSFFFLFSILAIVSTIYSIYYQYKVIKKWCFLCLCVVGILWLQAVITYFTFYWNFTFKSFILLSISSIVIIVMWRIIKPLTEDYLKVKKEQITNTRFKRNFNLFNTLLNTSSVIDTRINAIKEIVFGNKSSELEIVIVTNPYCGHCREVHQIIEDILEKYNDLKIIIRFNINTDDLTDDLVRITTRLKDIYCNVSEKDCLRAMKSIYEGTDFNTWINQWTDCEDKTPHIKTLNEQSQWCKQNRINFTPEILINGKSFPKEYNRSDLIYFIEDLEEIYRN